MDVVKHESGTPALYSAVEEAEDAPASADEFLTVCGVIRMAEKKER